jgi:flavodoxin
MEVAVVYESMFGNTRLIAEAIAEGMGQANPGAHVAIVPVTEASSDKLAAVDLLVVGGPTHIRRMSSSRTRKDLAPGPGLREWMSTLPSGVAGKRAAAFDTRFGYPLSGAAARPISRHLHGHGYVIVAKPEGFIVRQAKGPLKDGERERARAWGARLVS